MNWVLGHILVNRDAMLAFLGEEKALKDSEAEPYQRGSDPIDEGESALPLERLLAALDDTGRRLAEALQQASPEILNAVYDEERETLVRDRLEFLLLWHETYHLGQLEILRQLAGVDDAVI